KLASKYKIKTADLLEKLLLLEFVIKDKNGEYLLTEKGILVGGEAKNGRYGDYIIWPERLVIDEVLLNLK
ncbi:hypothetical protein NAI31_12095, partial [Francisella tularensis subsp. holarctica]|nr:hypothetical protein [Francisella tularensis subsp. holarctica]